MSWILLFRLKSYPLKTGQICQECHVLAWQTLNCLNLPRWQKKQDALWHTGSRNLTGQKTLPTIWGTYMKLVTKYQISVINSCWEKCGEKYTYMFNVYRNQLSRQTGSRNLMGPKTLPTIWYTYICNKRKQDLQNTIDQSRMRTNTDFKPRDDYPSTNNGLMSGNQNLGNF